MPRNENILPEEEIQSIILTDQEGNDVEFEFLDTVPYDGEEYVFLMPVDDESFSEKGEVVILKIEHYNDEEETYIGVEDDELLETVFELFKKKNNLD